MMLLLLGVSVGLLPVAVVLCEGVWRQWQAERAVDAEAEAILTAWWEGEDIL